MLKLSPAALFLAPLAQHKGRLVVSILAIALGVALGYAVQLINAVALNEFSQVVRSLSGEADLEIRGPRSGFDELIYPRISRLPQVAVASPVLELSVKLPGKQEPLRVLGLDAFRAAYVQPGLIGSAPRDMLDLLRPDTLFLSPAAADWLGVKEGDTVTVQVGLAGVRLRIAGLLRGSGRERLGVMDIAAAQLALDRLGSISRLDIRMRPGADLDELQARVRSELPPGLVVERPQSDLQRNASLSRSYRVNLNVLALVALLTGGFLVFSAQALSVVRRRSQLALLRVLGVTRGGLVRMLLAEGALTGVIGAAIGLAAGYLVAALVLARFGADLGAGQFRGLHPDLRADPWMSALFFTLGVLVAAAGSLAAALDAARAAPAQALKAGDEQTAFARLQPSWPGLILILLGAASTVPGPVAGIPLFGYLAIGLMLVGTLALMPRLATFVFGRLPRPGGIGARLALAQLQGAPGQAAVSLVAIVASFSLMVAMAIMVASFRLSLDAWLDRVLPADLYVRSGIGGDTAYLTPEAEARIAALPGVRRVEFLRIQQLLLEPGKPRVALFARAVDRDDPGRQLPLEGGALTPRSGAPPPLWASEAMVDLYGYAPGKVVDVPIAGKSRQFTVSGIWRDYARQHGTVIIERSLYIELSGDRNSNDAALYLQPGASAKAVEDAIRAGVPGGENLEFGAPGVIRARSLNIFDRTFAVTYALEAVAVIIGLFGLSSSFGALVLSRSREFGMLRHVGMTRREIGAMLAAEGALVSALGLALGLALGWVISLVLIHVVNRQSFHWSMELHLPWGLLAALAGALLLFATLTALASGRRALGIDVVRAVREDW
ncbi:MAG: FtsX-like permease family protein [Proteobacteria bacterium]|nr:FtsX-like permease family protein [Pseudomonadota bacterium]